MDARICVMLNAFKENDKRNKELIAKISLIIQAFNLELKRVIEQSLYLYNKNDTTC